MSATLELFDLLHRVMRTSHVTAGFIGLGLFWVPIFATKGSRLHVRVGRVFSYLAYYVGTTGLIASVWGLCHLSSFIGPEWANLSERARPYMVENSRFMFSILGFLSLAILSGVHFGIRVLRTRRDHATLPSRPLLVLQGAFGVWSLGLALFGAWNTAMIVAGRHLLPVAAAGRYSIPIVLGLFGVLGVYGDLKYILKPRPTPMAWWYKHMENMLGTGIGFHTAFLVFGMLRFLPIRLEGVWQLVPWLLPSVIGIPATHVWIRHYKRKFGELDATDHPPTEPAPVTTAELHR